MSVSTESNPAAALEQISKFTGELPSLPGAAIKALELISNPNVTARELQFEIARDQALAARIMKIVNSAMFCFEREVSSLAHGISILGLDTTRAIIVTASVQQTFKSNKGGIKNFPAKLFWQHSWGAAMAAKAIALQTGYPSSDEAFTCALLHDLGKIVMMRNRADQYAPVVAEVTNGNGSFREVELRIFGFSHAHVGSLLALKWRFPAQLVEGILYHHDPEEAPKHRRLARIVSLANLMMLSLGVGIEKNSSLDLAEQPSAKSLNLDEQAIEKLLKGLENLMSSMPPL
jgi:putative nucleotidyltransferase with HDIG domain